MCLMEGRCKSFNREIDGDMKCELNHKSTEDRKDNVTAVARPGWTFKSTDYNFHLLGQVCEAQDPCPKGVLCRDTCECPGYQCFPCQAGRTGLRCDDDIDECVTGIHNCGENGVCINNMGSFKCNCLSGYAWGGSSCSDIDECTSGSHNCGPNSVCRNNAGSFSCACNNGYHFDGSSCSAKQNLALSRTASQSSTYHQWSGFAHVASLANNGDRDGDSYKDKCAITEYRKNPWWRVDLGGRARVFRVTIQGGTNWKVNAINPFEIHVGDDNSNGGINNRPCVSSATLLSGQMKAFICPTGMKGRYVSIHLKRREYLQLCEVEVYGVLLTV
eukprot:Seg257.3 transcript_id=Seg257.3/GoldUCD/mRNA.D3Y31 product=Fucolectin-3 protein_id=Seg257.3/GoldUCD/D3Y31